jgi:hypothetical protein
MLKRQAAPGTSGDRPVLKQRAEPVPAVIVPVYTMGLAREGTCRLEQTPKKGRLQRCQFVRAMEWS